MSVPSQAAPASLLPRVLLIGALVVVFASFAPALQYEFVYDDHPQIVENLYTQSWQHVPRYFTEHVWAYFYPSLKGNYYRPMFLLWLLVNYTLFGLLTFWWHLVSILVHVGVTCAVYLLARRLLRDDFAALAAALLFGLHPAHTEAVVWVSGVTEPLLAILLIPAFLCYLRQREETRPEAALRRARWMAASLFFFALALLSKETALVFPALVVAYEWLHAPAPEAAGGAARLARLRASLAGAMPILLLAGIFLLFRAVILSGLSHRVTEISAGTMAMTLPSVLWFYARQLVLPFPLSPFYDLAAVREFSVAGVVLPLVPVLAVALGLWQWGRRSKAAAFAAVWLIVPLLPVLNLAVLSEIGIVQDRYLYLPSVGFCLLAAMALRKLPAAGQAALLGAVSLLLVLGIVTQSRYWADDFTFYERGAVMAPHNRYTLNNYANELAHRGRDAEALALYQQILERSPDFDLAVYNLGYFYYKRGRLAEAEQYLLRSIDLNPRGADSFLYLGLTRMRMNRPADAEAAFRRAIATRPQAANYHFALGVLLKTQRRYDEALGEFEQELKVNPTNAAVVPQIHEVYARKAATPRSP